MRRSPPSKLSCRRRRPDASAMARSSSFRSTRRFAFAPVSAARAPSDRTGYMILIADNDDSTRMVLTCSLERSGYAVEPVTDGQLLWPRLEAGGVDLLILDLRMPGMNGWEVLRRLRDRYHRESDAFP